MHCGFSIPSQTIKNKLNRYIALLDKQYKKNELPATVIGAEHGFLKMVDKSGSVPNPLNSNLKRNLETIGLLGSSVNGNHLGCCCEVRASNRILRLYDRKCVEIPLSDIVFTSAIRPRTKQIIPMCVNCQTVFKKWYL